VSPQPKRPRGRPPNPNKVVKPKSTFGGAGRGQGRKKGKHTAAVQRQINEAAASGELPLAYMLRIMRDETQSNDRRDSMAIAAAPYVHAKLSVTKLNASGGIIVRLDSDDEKL
jgi:hypothetical protein